MTRTQPTKNRFLFFLGVLALAHGAIAQTEASISLSGHVLLPDEEPVTDARLWLLQRGVVSTATTDAEGRYAFEELQKGKVTLVALSEGRAINGFETFLIESVEKADVLLPEAEPFLTRVINRRSEPIAGARMKTIHVNEQIPNREFYIRLDELIPHGFPSLRSDETGRLEVPFLPKGTFNGIRIGHHRYAELEIPSVPVDANIDFPLPDGIRLSGRVSNAQDHGVAGARVSVFIPLEQASVEVGEAVTGPEGFYTVRVPAGRYAVAAWHPDYALSAPVDANCTDTDVEATANCSLPSPITVTGQVLDMDGAPVPWATITYRSDNLELDKDFTDRDGRYRITAAEGQGIIRVTPPPRLVTEAYPEQGFISEGLTLLEMPPFLLKPLPSVHGKISVPDQADPSQIMIRTLNVEPPIYAVTDAEGRFTIQLEQAMFDEPVRFRAEHALRFLKGEFEFNVLRPKSIEIKLRSFQPKIPKGDEPEPNPLAHMVGDPAPEWSCDAWINVDSGSEGGAEPVTLESLKGKVVVLTLWGGFDKLKTRHRMWELNAMYHLLKDRDDVAFVSIHDASYEPARVEEYVNELGVLYPVGCDADPFLSFDLYNVNRIPQTIIIDKQGILRYYRTDDRILELIKDLRRRG